MAKKATLSKKIKKSVEEYIRLLKKDKLPIKKVIVFGSQAKKTTYKWSDIDVCIISPKFKDSFEALHYLLMKSYQVKALIEPHPIILKILLMKTLLFGKLKELGL
jgi:predicted nucleotidyltransferase